MNNLKEIFQIHTINIMVDTGVDVTSVSYRDFDGFVTLSLNLSPYGRVSLFLRNRAHAKKLVELLTQAIDNHEDEEVEE